MAGKRYLIRLRITTREGKTGSAVLVDEERLKKLEGFYDMIREWTN